MKTENYLVLVFTMVTLSLGFIAVAEESTLEKLETQKNKSMDGARHVYRTVDNRVCEMVNGKEKCVIKKVKNRAKDAADQIKTNTNELMNKVD